MMHNDFNQSNMRLGVSEFVEYFNQTIEYAYNRVIIFGEIANIRFKNQIIYFDLKDNSAKISFWGYKNMSDFPVIEGMTVEVVATPKLHPQYGFKLSYYSIKLVGEGTIKKSIDLLKEKLNKEGIFDESRKRQLLYPPKSIGLITSLTSAAYADFIKILSDRSVGIDIYTSDVLVQGEKSVEQIINAIEKFNQAQTPVDILVITRGGGSPEDLQYFNSEKLVRSIAASRIPTIVAIGHEVDISLAELVADKRASTPSNAAEIISPDKMSMLKILDNELFDIGEYISSSLTQELSSIKNLLGEWYSYLKLFLENEVIRLNNISDLIEAYNPRLPLERGYSIILKAGKYIHNTDRFFVDDNIEIETKNYQYSSIIKSVKEKHDK